ESLNPCRSRFRQGRNDPALPTPWAGYCLVKKHVLSPPARLRGKSKYRQKALSAESCLFSCIKQGRVLDFNSIISGIIRRESLMTTTDKQSNPLINPPALPYGAP